MRSCADCKLSLGRRAFSSAQWKKSLKIAGRCISCIALDSTGEKSCGDCHQIFPRVKFFRNEWRDPTGRCKPCHKVDLAQKQLLAKSVREASENEAASKEEKCCGGCRQTLTKDKFSKYERKIQMGRCVPCLKAYREEEDSRLKKIIEAEREEARAYLMSGYASNSERDSKSLSRTRDIDGYWSDAQQSNSVSFSGIRLSSGPVRSVSRSPSK
jgi:hypothetical protein